MVHFDFAWLTHLSFFVGLICGAVISLIPSIVFARKVWENSKEEARAYRLLIPAYEENGVRKYKAEQEKVRAFKQSLRSKERAQTVPLKIRGVRPELIN